MINLLRPKYFILGVFLGFIVCVVVGHIISTKGRFHHYVRFFTHISPATQYYPTAHELLLTAMTNLSPDQIVVVVGGNSIFKGVGQNTEELWSQKLQAILGPKFKVINFAMDGAYFTAFGAVVYRILNDLYPKVIFVATCNSSAEANIEGGDGLTFGYYSYLFWDAYYKNLFHPDKEELRQIKKRRRQQIFTEVGFEKHSGSFLDSFFYFRNLWNWVNYRIVTFVWSDFRVLTPFKPLRFYKDGPYPYSQKDIERVLNDHARNELEAKQIGVGYAKLDLTRNATEYDHWVQMGMQNVDRAFTSRHRSKILCVQPVFNSNLIQLLPKDVQDKYWAFVQLSKLVMEKENYHVIVVGKDFLPQDYADNTHFAASGGYKLAAEIAQKVNEIATENGFNY